MEKQSIFNRIILIIGLGVSASIFSTGCSLFGMESDNQVTVTAKIFIDYDLPKSINYAFHSTNIFTFSGQDTVSSAVNYIKNRVLSANYGLRYIIHNHDEISRSTYRGSLSELNSQNVAFDLYLMTEGAVRKNNKVSREEFKG